MTNNDILRRLRYVFDFDDSKMIALFELAGCQVTNAQLHEWLKKDDDPAFRPCSDPQLATFLNGLIIDRRGKKNGAQPVVEQRLTNNIIFRKLKIALELRTEDIIQLISLAGMRLSEHDLSALFRTPGHRHYRTCKDQILRNFLKGLQLEHRAEALKPPVNV